MEMLQRKSELGPEDLDSAVAGMGLQNKDDKLESQDQEQWASLLDDEIERQIKFAYADARDWSMLGWNYMWKTVLEKLFPSDRYCVTIESRKVKVWTFEFLFVTRNQDSRKVLMALCSCPLPRTNTDGWFRKKTLVLSYLSAVGKEVQDGRRMYCLGFVGTDFSWGWMENGDIKGIDPTTNWRDFDVVGSHESLHELAECVGDL